jgi:NAD(P)-dependent dehydrogenase (short-subunit alcohol dehydrogenase family)
MTETILITGSNRGIGLELVHQYAAQGWQVLACCRRPDQATALNRLGEQFPDITIYALDVAQQDQVQKLAANLRDCPIDILFNNAGIYGPYDAVFGNTDEARWLECLHINVIAPMKMMEAFSTHVAASKHKLIAAMSSKMGSMADNGSGGSYIYRSSKAALNAIMKSAAIDLAPLGVKVAILHPGWVQTDMGGPNAEITVAESVGRMREILGTITPGNSGTFFDIDGSIIPW